VEAYPESLQETIKNGGLPLHFAIRYGELEVIRYLVHAYPESLQVTDNDGLLPLHYA
jgi:ankyrin repeat protein